MITDYVNSKGSSVSPKKLQKLVYYVDAWHQVYFEGASIVDEEFEAWVHGPVVNALYQELKEYGFQNIHVIDDELDDAQNRIDKIIADNGLSPEQVSLIYSVLNRYFPLSSFELELLTHSELPWMEARNGLGPQDRSRKVISKPTMYQFYSSQI